MLMGACSCGYYAGGCSCCNWACVGQLGVRWGCATHEANWVLSAPNVRANVVFLSSVLLNIVAGLRCLHCLHLHRGRAVRQAAAGAEAVGVASGPPPPPAASGCPPMLLATPELQAPECSVCCSTLQADCFFAISGSLDSWRAPEQCMRA